MGGRGAVSGGVTAGFKNSTLKKNNPYMNLSKASISSRKAQIEKVIDNLDRKARVAESIIRDGKSKTLVSKQKTILTKARKRIDKLNFEYAQASYAEKYAKKNNAPF